MIDSTIFYLLTLIIFIISSLLMLKYFSSKSYRFSPAVIFIFLFMLTDSLYALYSYNYPHEYYSNIVTFIDNHTSKGFVLFLNIISLFFIFLGYAFANPKIKETYFSRTHHISALKKLKFFSLLIAIIGVFLFSYFYINTGGIDNPYQFANLYRNSYFRGSGIYTFLIVNLIPLIIQLSLILMTYISSRSIKFKFWQFMLLAVFFIVTSLLGFRMSWVYLVFPLLWIYIYNKKKNISYVKLAFFFILTNIIFSLYGNYRAQSEYSLRGISIQQNIAYDFVEPIIRTNSLDVVSTSILYGNEHDYFLKFIAQPFVNFLPNALWVNKFNNNFSESVGYKFYLWREGEMKNQSEIKMSGMSPTFIGFSYWQAGYVGIIFYSFFIGYLLKHVIKNLNSYKKISVYRVLNTLALSTFLLIQLSSPQDALNGLVQNIILIYFLYILLNIRIRK